MSGKCECPKCGGSLVIRFTRDYRKIYNIRRDGTIGRLRSAEYGHNKDWDVYCNACGIGFDGRFLDGKFVVYTEDEE